jgi:hypothetical protein
VEGVSERSENRFPDAQRFGQHLSVREAQDAKVLGTQPRIAVFVVALSCFLVMLPTIYLDDKPRIEAGEVDERLLPAELAAFELALAEECQSRRSASVGLSRNSRARAMRRFIGNPTLSSPAQAGGGSRSPLSEPSSIHRRR